MKKADYNKSLREKTLAQLQKELTAKQKELAQARLELKVNKLNDVNLPHKLADDIARIKTEIRNKTITAQAEQVEETEKENQEAVKEQE